MLKYLLSVSLFACLVLAGCKDDDDNALPTTGTASLVGQTITFRTAVQATANGVYTLTANTDKYDDDDQDRDLDNTAQITIMQMGPRPTASGAQQGIRVMVRLTDDDDTVLGDEDDDSDDEDDDAGNDDGDDDDNDNDDDDDGTPDSQDRDDDNDGINDDDESKVYYYYATDNSVNATITNGDLRYALTGLRQTTASGTPINNGRTLTATISER